MAKPWIGIPTRFHDNGQTVGKIGQYLEPVLWAGGLPVMIPTFAPQAVWTEYMERLDGVLLPGSGSDIDPARYGQPAHPKLGKIVPDRDALDFSLLQHAEQSNLPVLGICFGAQSLNVFRGGTLVQDIPSVISGAIFHNDHGEPPEQARHVVKVSRDSLLKRLAAADVIDDVIEVNSFHHQSVENIGAGLRVVATSEDGVIEAIEDSGERFVVGVQWHPERGFQDDPVSKALFTAFIREAAKSKSHSN